MKNKPPYSRKLRIFDICLDATGGGPSPDANHRTLVNFAGCGKAMSGHPCKGCCNPLFWNKMDGKVATVDEVFLKILYNGLPYVTFGGGEPTDQKKGVIQLAHKLRCIGFHIIMFSWHSRSWFTKNWSPDELRCFDMIITEPYDETQHIADCTKNDGVHNAIGSANQEIWINPATDNMVFLAGNVAKMEMDEDLTLKIYLHNGEICECKSNWLDY